MRNNAEQHEQSDMCQAENVAAVQAEDLPAV
jgi:hypothetical protein